MGNNTSNLNYISQSTNPLEEKIRLFEINSLLNINTDDKFSNEEKSFSSIYSRICIDSELFQGKNEENLRKFLISNFNKRMADFITKRSYFRLDGESEYDMKKLRILFFLLTFNMTTASNSDHKISDKVKK
jgi:hypothetical protein